MIVVGLSAKAQHGKGSTVQLTQIKRQSGDDELEVRQISFATELKLVSKTVVTLLQQEAPSGWHMSEAGMSFGEEEAYFYLVRQGLPCDVAIQVIDLARGLTTKDLKDKTPRGRKLLQFIGTEAFRRHVDDLFWVKKVAEKIKTLPPETEIVYIPDCRFPNEADYVRETLGGEVWRLERYNADGTPFDNGLTPEQKAHPSENALNDYRFDRVIRHVTMDDLFREIKVELKRLGIE